MNKPRHGFVLWLLAVPFLAASLGLLSAAVNIYVAVSALLLLAQRAIVTGWLAARIGQVRAMLPGGSAWLANSGIVDLTDVARLQACGNKASRLGVLKRAGISVPSGVVLTAKFLNDYNAASEAGRARRLKRVWARVGSDKVAVRSAASSEDGASRSFAGVFESVLNVSQLNFAKAIDRVAQSFVSDRAKSYGPAAGASNIIVQRMVPAQYSGVMFTRDPAAAGMILVELVEGLADEMVSGAKTPTAFRFGRLSGRPFDAVGTKPPVELEELLAIGQQAETLFGAPQDIEWAYSDGCFQIVQCRDIVPLAIEGDAQIIHAEWSRVLSLVAKRPVAEVALVQSELSELLPRPTPLSLSLMQDLWSSGGSVDLACSRLGLRYAVDEASPDYVVTVLGQLYVDQHEVTKRAPHIGSLSLRRLLRTSKQFEADFRDRFLPEFLSDIRLAEAIDFDRLATPDLVAALTRRWTHFVENTHVEVDIVNILAQLYLDEAKRKLTSAKRDAGTYLAARGTSEPKRVLAAAMAASGAERSTLLVSGMGHRAVLDYELAQPRYAEQLSALAQLGSESAVAVGPAKTPPTLDPGLAATVARACDFQVLKEDAKHHSLRELAVLRRIVLAVDRRFELDGSVFHLTLAELQELPTAGRDSARGLAAERQRHRQSFAGITLPSSSLTPAAIEASSAGVALSAERHARLGGTRVAGSQVAIGRARVMSPIAAQAGQPIADFQPSDIIVSRMIHSDWLPHLKHAGGLVSEIGGWLSHMALVAREYDLPMIVGCQGISAISDGDVVELQLDGRISILENRLPMVAE